MKNETSIFIWIILAAVFVASIRHIAEAYHKRDHMALGEGFGTMLFSGMIILIKALG